MKTNTIVHFLAPLFLAVVLLPASQAQTCNPNIPLATPGSEFTDHRDGTITHHRTRLMWKKCREGWSGSACDQGSAIVVTWSEALTHAISHEFADYSDWRLPNIKELATIVELACYDVAINLSVFPSYLARTTWSSSPNASSANEAWTLNLKTGSDDARDKDTIADVWLVRDGQ